MIIKEIKNNKYKITPYKMSNDEIIQGLEPPFNYYNFYYIINGIPGSGKTNLLLNLLTKKGKFFNKKFDRVYIFSPSLKTVTRTINLPEERIFDTFDLEVLQMIIDIENAEKNKILLVFDDMIANMKKNQKEMLKLIYNRRHIGGGVSIIITSQVFNKIPAEIRKVATLLFMYKTTNKQEKESIFNDFINITKNEYENILNYCWKDKHDFIMIDCNNGEFYNGFNKLYIEY